MLTCDHRQAVFFMGARHGACSECGREFTRAQYAEHAARLREIEDAAQPVSHPYQLTPAEAAALAWATASHTTPHYHAEALRGLAARMTQNNVTPDA